MTTPMTREEFEDRDRYLKEQLRKSRDIENRFCALFGYSGEGAEARKARELVMDGELRDIPPAHRLVIVRQLLIALEEHGLYDYDRNDADTHLRAIAVRMGVPFVEVYLADKTSSQNPDTTRADLDDWLEWCREHAPERLAPVQVEAPANGKARKGRRS